MALVSTTTIDRSDEMQCFGSEIAAHFTHSDIIAINGPLGAGKTTLVKGIVSRFNPDDEVTSPTFSIINFYERSKIYHADLYRINTREQMILSGISDIADSNQHLMCIEWFKKFFDYITPTYIINIELNAMMSRYITCTKTNYPH